jgi:transposase
MIIAHKIALAPNDRQATYFARACGTARFAYNWALGEWQRQYAAWKDDPKLPRPSEAALRRHLNAIKEERFPWMLEVTKNAVQQAVKNLGSAFKRFFDGNGKYPRFKKKGIHDSSGPIQGRTNSIRTPSKPSPARSSCRSSVGCGCMRRCASAARFCLRWCRAPLTVGSSA